MIDFEFEFQYAEEKQPTLQKVGGSIPAGRCVVLCGGSGCGKSTLLRCINGLIPQFYEGELKGFCRLNGQDTAGLRIGEIGELAASVFHVQLYMKTNASFTLYINHWINITI